MSARPRFALPPEAGYAVANAARLAANAARARQAAPDYVSFVLDGDYPDLAPPRNFLQQKLLPPVTSLAEIDARLRAVAGDPRPTGVLIHLRGLDMPLARLQALRDSILRLRAAGKRVVAWSHSLGTGSYYVATAADEILIQPGSGIAPLGLKLGFTFLAESLERAGLRFDAVAISPYKSAADMFTRRDMSEEVRAMAEWLLDANYATLLGAIAEGRGIDRSAAADLIDGAPYTDLQALAAGAVDGILGEEDLPAHLGSTDAPARIETWSAARKQLLVPALGRGGRHLALIRIEGMIVDGESERPPMPSPLPIPLAGGPRAGDLTVVQEARAALEDESVAGVVLYIDSPGGSATASEAIAAALARLAERKPVVAVMGAIAGSGGYYVATPARWIVAQPGTLTGSIGVIGGKLVTAGLLDRLRTHREQLTRGRNVDFGSSERPYSEAERAQLRGQIERIYTVFVDRVAASRRMSPEAVDALGGGRVWTGSQACEQGLVDALGGLEEGYAKARELAGLHRRAPVRTLQVGKTSRAPLPSAEAALAYTLAGLRALDRSTALCLCPILAQAEI